MGKMFEKKQHMVLLFLSFCIFGMLLNCKTLNDYEENVVKKLNSPSLSVESGFYEDEFYLELSSDDQVSVYYTLDGSIPDENSFLYQEPIMVENATEYVNGASMIKDVSAGFRTDLLEQYQILDSDPGYEAPDYLIEKCTVIRAVAIDEHGNRSNESIGTYFVGILPEVYDGCSIISLVTEPKNLFDYEKGIYVTGKKLDEYLLRDDVGATWEFWDANYRQRGKAWERDAHVSFFSADGELFLDKTVGVRIRGGVSRSTLPKGLNLYARTADNKADIFGFALFGNSYDPEAISLTSGGNQLITQFNDYMMTDRVSGLNISTTKFEPYVLFINGEYWGFYWLSEKYDEHYFEHYYDVEANDVVMIKNGEVELGTDQDYRLYHEMRNYITLMDMSNAAYYERACEMIDIESFIDYYATMLYIGRCNDWPLNNYALWRTRSDDGEAFDDGKWRWILFDCNSTSMTADLTLDDNLLMLLKSDPLFIALWDNLDFQETFKQRLQYITETCFDAEEMDAYISQYMEQMKPILEKSWKRFYGSDNKKEEEFAETLESNRKFFIERPKVIEEILLEY